MAHLTHRAPVIGALAALALAPPGVRAQSREPYAGLDAYVGTALHRWHVPGTAIAIVRNDSVIYARGYGVREIGKPTPVDERTIFAIGSLTKAFTATAAAMLVDDGMMRFDAPVTTYIPDFRLADPAARDVTLRDLLVQRTGLDRNDLLWYGSSLDRDEIVRRARYLPPMVPFRSAFTYSNIMYLAAGQAVAHAAGMTWDDFVRTRIFAPLGMSSTDTKLAELAGRSDVATPHAESEGAVRVIPWRSGDNVGPAGSITSNVLDMAQWLRFQLNDGTVAGRRLLSQPLVETMHSAQVAVPMSDLTKRFTPGTHLTSYGMGWMVSDYEGQLMLKHNGNIDGMSSYAVLLPERRFGVVILSNLNGTPMGGALGLRIIDAELRRPARDWSADLATLFDSVMARQASIAAAIKAQRVPGTHPSRELAAYAGTYVDSAFGEIRIAEDRGSLSFAFSGWRGTLEHWHYDTFVAPLPNPEFSSVMLQFQLDPSGSVNQIRMDEGEIGSATFRRVQPVNNTATATAGRQGARP